MLTDETKGLTVEKVKAEIQAEKERASKRLRHLRALLRCLEDENQGPQPELPFGEEDDETK